MNCFLLCASGLHLKVTALDSYCRIETCILILKAFTSTWRTGPSYFINMDAKQNVCVVVVYSTIWTLILLHMYLNHMLFWLLQKVKSEKIVFKTCLKLRNINVFYLHFILGEIKKIYKLEINAWKRSIFIAAVFLKLIIYYYFFFKNTD